jgi:hypothetical protein
MNGYKLYKFLLPILRLANRKYISFREAKENEEGDFSSIFNGLCTKYSITLRSTEFILVRAAAPHCSVSESYSTVDCPPLQITNQFVGSMQL